MTPFCVNRRSLREVAKSQILAPAGSVEQLIAAVNNGCDAVYLGLDSFNARMKAPNFTLNNLTEWVDYCHLFSVKVYVAINTSLKNCEFLQAVKLLLSAYRCNVDGVIVTDIALMRVAGLLPKPFEVVASTQLNIHDKYGAEFVKKCGATTVVCARECSMADIREIASTDIDVESFLHGAVCVCQSGQCLFSSMVGGNSGNRGLCAQPCRKYYYVGDKVDKGGYLLSARDTCGLDSAKELVEAGVTTFKIEGRNRRPEYAGLTSRVYKRVFDNDFKYDENDYTELAEMFNRSMSKNHYLSGENFDIVYPMSQNHIGVEVGVINCGAVDAFRTLNKGDGLKVFDDEKEICGGIVLEDGIGRVKAQFSGRVNDGMSVRRTTCAKLCGDVLSVKRKLNVDMTFIAKIGQHPKLVARCEGVNATVEGAFDIEEAKSVPVNSDEIVKQLRKSGETHYTINDIVIESDNIFIAKSQINSLRRGVLDELTQKIIREYNDRFAVRSNCNLTEIALIDKLRCANGVLNSQRIAPSIAAVCRNEYQLVQAKALCDFVVYKPNIIDLDTVQAANRYDAYLDLPSFVDLDYVCSLLQNTHAKLFCNNVGQVELARSLGIAYIVGGGLNVFNDYMLGEFADSDTFVYSRELTLREIDGFANKSGLTFVDGQIPLMQLCHCPYKVALGCDCKTCKSAKELIYRDELGNRFFVRRRLASRCHFELFNGNKLSVVSKLKTPGKYLVDYDKAVLEHYININSGIDDGYAESQPYTKGRLYDKIN